MLNKSVKTFKLMLTSLKFSAFISKTTTDQYLTLKLIIFFHKFFFLKPFSEVSNFFSGSPMQFKKGRRYSLANYFYTLPLKEIPHLLIVSKLGHCSKSFDLTAVGKIYCKKNQSIHGKVWKNKILWILIKQYLTRHNWQTVITLCPSMDKKKFLTLRTAELITSNSNLWRKAYFD